MKLTILSLALGSLFCFTTVVAQQDTDIYVSSLHLLDGVWNIGTPNKISNSEGYNNQPSFLDAHRLLFAATRDNQTDIARYDFDTKTVNWVSNTKVGSEYSPTAIPNTDQFSSIRLDTTGLQRLYTYHSTTGDSELLVKDAKIGYHLWYSETILITTVLVANRMDLVVFNLAENTNKVLQENVGRSLQKIPNSDLVSYVSVKNKDLVVKSIHPITGKQETIIKLPSTSEYITWLPDGSILTGYKSSLLRFQPKADTEWQDFYFFADKDINNISRLAVSPDAKKLAFVAEPGAYRIVQKQVDYYNAGNLDAFINCYSEDVVVRNFPSDTLYVGHEKMRKNYSGLSPENENYTVEVVKRITLGNNVVDQERLTGKGKIEMQVALYKVNNGAISNMTFIFDDNNAPNPETIVQEQLDAYNARNIDDFLKTYTEDIEIYTYGEGLRSAGKAALRENFTQFFKSTPDLHCEIKNRIVIGNKVIDHEWVTARGGNFSVIAIYEVENGKIARVTFVR